MKAKKENKTYRITTEQEKQRYLKDGFDIYDDEGKLLEYSPLKKISYGEYDKLQQENKALCARVAELEALVDATKQEAAETQDGKDVKKAAQKAGE